MYVHTHVYMYIYIYIYICICIYTHAKTAADRPSSGGPSEVRAEPGGPQALYLLIADIYIITINLLDRCLF